MDIKNDRLRDILPALEKAANKGMIKVALDMRILDIQDKAIQDGINALHAEVMRVVK